MKKNRQVYINGNFVDESEAKISIYDSALMFGDMVFEMTRSFNKKQFKLKEHIDRLFIGIKILRIPIQISPKELEDICYRTIEVNDHLFSDTDEHRLMFNVSRGPLGIYSHVFGDQMQPTIVVADFPLKWTVASMGKLFDTGINAVIPSQRAISAQFMEPKIKNRSRLFYQMANIEVSQYKGDNNWALLLDQDGYVTEGTGDNFFIVKNNKIITPEGRNILRGISREYIFELAKQLDLECMEKNFEPYDVYTADEAFMTGTPFCILPVSSLNSLKIGLQTKGPITEKLLNQWSKNVGLDIETQIKDFGKEVNSASNINSPSPYQFQP